MCGIAGYLDLHAPPQRPILEAMAATLRRRGPDAVGFDIDAPCGLAHARLIVLDAEGGLQPMRAEGSPVTLCYNGELYNFTQLRDELARAGTRCRTRGDTEVLLRWVSEHWNTGLHRLEGMFGFAAWDRDRQRLLLARDPFGIKPLFYASPRPGLLVFASEIKAILAHPEVRAETDEDALRQALRFRAVYGERTLFAGIRQLPPGAWLTFDRSGEAISGHHFNIALRTARVREQLHSLTDEQLIHRGDDTLAAAVRSHMVADVPVGAFLSGGLDSSLITALMREARDPSAELHTFSVGFEGDHESELPHAAEVARALGTRHHEVRVGPSDYIERLADLTQCRDAPLSEPADVAVGVMSERARRIVTVVLSGEGADETFAGYPKYRFASPNAVLRMGVRTLGPANVERLARLGRIDVRKARIAARALASRTDLESMTQWFSYLDRARLAALLPGLGWGDASWDRTLAPQRDAITLASWDGHLARMQGVDCLTWLPGNLLERGDRMTMSASLEMRVPFLDASVAVFGLALPNRCKLRRGEGKWLLRRIADNRLPESIVNRRKWGFRVPLAQWFRGPLRDLLESSLMSEGGLIAAYADRAAVRTLLDDHLAKRTDASWELWTLLATDLWWRHARSRQPARSFEPALSMTPS